MHEIQKFIIVQLSENTGLRYSQMRPPSMEPSQFMYHLKILINKDLVVKLDSGYSLTKKGVQFVDHFDDENLELYEYARVTVAFVYEHTEHGVLLMQRQHQPAIGRIGFYLVDVPFDYTPPLTNFATKHFERIAGINCSFTHRANGYIRLNKNNILEANMLTHVLYSKDNKMPEMNIESVWQKDANKSKIFSSTAEIIELLSSNDEHFFFELETEI